MAVIRYETAVERAFLVMGCLFYEAKGMFYALFMGLAFLMKQGHVLCSLMLLKALLCSLKLFYACFMPHAAP